MGDGQTAAVKAAADQKTDPLKNLSPRDQKAVQDVMAQHPLLTADEALQALKDAGM
jgi:hypothetical protein